MVLLATEKRRQYRKGGGVKAQRKELVFGYLATPEENRLPLPKFLKLHRMQKPTFYMFQGEYKAEKLSFTKKEEEMHKQKIKGEVLDAWDRLEGKDPKERKAVKASESWLKSQSSEINEALIQSCKNGNAQALRLYFQLTEQLVEKKEAPHKLDGDYLAREILRARGELQDSGMGQV